MAHFKKIRDFNIPQLIVLLTCLFAGACASIQQPTGGPRDKEPPKVLGESPKNLSRNFKEKKVEIEFDEFIKLSNEFKEISVSPAFDKNPSFKIKKKVLEITFLDTLEKNTTYTINFGKGIIDYNEGNVLKNYSYVFATGNVIDSLSISGSVINAISKEPEMETTVLIVPANQDTLFTKKRANLFTTTDSSGNFTLKNLKAGTYRIYALKEQGGDRIYNSTNEEIAFQKDSIVLKANTDSIKLQLFKEEPPNFRVLDYKLFTDGHFLLRFNTRLKEPALKLLDVPDLDSKKKTEFNSVGDSALLWLPEITFDTLSVAIMNKGISLDTVIFRRSKKDTYNQALIVSDNLAASKVRQTKGIVLTLSAPVGTFDKNKITLLSDSIPVSGFVLEKDSTSSRRYFIRYNWREKKEYILELEDNAFTSFNGGKNKATSKVFKLDPEVNYGNILTTISVPDTTASYLVQLLGNNDEILKSTRISKSGTINYIGYAPGKYNIRVVYDLNKNGQWDTGNLKNRTQPEPIWNFPTEQELLANFDIPVKVIIPPDQ